VKNHSCVVATVLAAAVWMTASACASGSHYNYQRDDYREFGRRAYDAGHHDGISHGEDDARHRRERRIDRDSDYRSADRGYRGEYGDRENYRRAFRQGYGAGYAEGFDRIERSGRDRIRDGRLSSPATQNGYRDGLDVGARDARGGQRLDPGRAKWYRNGDRDYDRRYGSRDDYKRDYRVAFQEGYEEGFRIRIP
jgi:subtilisin family serine protease